MFVLFGQIFVFNDNCFIKNNRFLLYLIKNIFAETHFKNKYLYIDCSDDQAFTEFNLKHNSLDKLLQYLKIEY